jgi:hypothetical protein
MPIDKMIIVKLILKIKFFGYHVNVISLLGDAAQVH